MNEKRDTKQKMIKLNGNLYICDHHQADISGNEVEENIYLVGRKSFGPTTSFIDNIVLVIQDGKTGEYLITQLDDNGGYNPKIFLGDFTGDGNDDIFISIDSGGSGGLTFYYIYTYKDNKAIKIFDHRTYNNRYIYDVNYHDGYKVYVKNLQDLTTFTIDIKNIRNNRYLSQIYEDNGNLKRKIIGSVNPLGGLYPVDFNRDGVYELLTYQRIIGQYNADSLGYVQNVLKWNNNRFEVYTQNVTIDGSKPNKK